MVDPEVQKRRYRELMGDEAAARQERLAKITCVYCGGKDGQHSQMCRKRGKAAPQR